MTATIIVLLLLALILFGGLKLLVLAAKLIGFAIGILISIFSKSPHDSGNPKNQ